MKSGWWRNFLLHPTTRSRYADLPRWAALGVLGIFTLLLSWGIVLSPADFEWDHFGNFGCVTADEEFYGDVTNKVKEGDNYYDYLDKRWGEAAPDLPVYAWRFPTYAYLLGLLPDLAWGYWALIVFEAAVIGLMTVVFFWEFDLLSLLLALGGVGGATLYFATGCNVYFMTEPWTGVLILLSLCAYARQRPGLGLAVALAALFLRELAVVYYVSIGVVTCLRRRWLALAAWSLGLAAFCGAFVLHWQEIENRRPLNHPFSSEKYTDRSDRVDPNAELLLVNLSYMTLLEAVGQNGILFALPRWIWAFYFPIALVGLVGWRTGAGDYFLSAALLFTAFHMLAFGGYWYWGHLSAPLFAVGFGRAPRSLYDLARAIKRPRAV